MVGPFVIVSGVYVAYVAALCLCYTCRKRDAPDAPEVPESEDRYVLLVDFKSEVF